VNELFLGLIPAFAGGIVLGAFFFAGLWFSVRKLNQAKRPGLVLAVSYMLRMITVIGGLFLLTDGDWRRLAAALTAFILVRMLMVRLVGPHAQTSILTLPGER
jgi:F1F0 ATPase subunit 2